MMLKLHDSDGRVHYVASGAIAHIEETAASSQWHGIRSLVYLSDGTRIECSQKADEVITLMNRETNE